VHENVFEWTQKPEWSFRFDTLQEGAEEEIPERERRTTIAVTDLHESVRIDLGLNAVQERLKQELEEAQLRSMRKGLRIELNGKLVLSKTLHLLRSDAITPAYLERALPERVGVPDEQKVVLRLYVGIAESDPKEAGWYVFCNDRLIVGANRSDLTGWGDTGNDKLPKYHNQYARFRGYVTFDCDDASQLPWNTTKTGLDSDARVFRAARQDMKKLAEPVIRFLDRLKDETQQDHDEQPLKEAVDAAKPIDFYEIETLSTFVAPTHLPIPAASSNRVIRYTKPVEEFNAVKRRLKVETPQQVGEMTFEYFLEMECGD